MHAATIIFYPAIWVAQRDPPRLDIVLVKRGTLLGEQYVLKVVIRLPPREGNGNARIPT